MDREKLITTRPPLSAKVTWAFIIAALYLPQMWYFLMDYPWSDYRLYWLKFFPGLPAMIPLAPIGHGWIPNIWVLVIALWFTTGAMAATLFTFRRKGRKIFFIALTVVALWSTVSAVFAYGAFRT